LNATAKSLSTNSCSLFAYSARLPCGDAMNATVYTIPNCPKCSAAKALLKRKGVEFKEVDVVAEKATNQWAFDENPMFPVVMLDGARTEGFEALKEVLK